MAYFKAVNNTRAFLPAFNKQMQENLQAAAMAWHGAAVDELGSAGGARTGRFYRVPNTRRMYQASAAGQAPATRLGDLRQRMAWRVNKWDAEVGNPLDYAATLEKGSSRMKARPFLQPAYNKERDQIMAELNRNVRGWS